MPTCPSYCVLEMLSWQLKRHVSKVMATVQISVVAEEKRGGDPPFLVFDPYYAKSLGV